MSENELIRNSMGGVGDEDNKNDAIISICESDPVDWIKVEEKLKKIYVCLIVTPGAGLIPHLRQLHCP